MNKHKDPKIAQEQRELALQSKAKKLAHKQEQEKNLIFKKQLSIAQRGVNEFLLRGLPFEDFKDYVFKNNKDQAYIEGLLKAYPNENARYKIPGESLEYAKNLTAEFKKREGHNLVMYMPVFDILEIKRMNDVVAGVIHTINGYQYTAEAIDGTIKNRYFPEGHVDGLCFTDVLTNDELVIVDKTTGDVLTKHTEFIEKEVIKVKTETKIVKQEVKKGLSSKEIDKALENTRREFKNKFFDESLLNQILESIKNNLK
jgi:hypothetical protein